MKKHILTILTIAMFTTLAFSQDAIKTNSLSRKRVNTEVNRRHSVGTTLFLLGNLVHGNHPYYFQLNYGYLLTPKDNLIVEAITETIYEPLGTYGSSKLYPGKVRFYGLGLGYQRFFWKNLYTTIEPAFFLQQFFDTKNIEIQKGFLLYLQFHLGYRFEFFNKRFFVEPALALKYWPINTNFPASFAAIETGARNYALESSLNIGVRF
jgi:hypothetical protein